MLRCFFTALIVVCVMGGRAQVTVFSSDEGGYAFFRIPAIVGLSRGDLLAFAEGRVNDSGDFGNIDLVMKRSRDNCRTWSSLQLVVDQTNVQAGNPAPVVDLLDPEHPKGVGYLFYNTGNIHENEVRKGNGVREVWYVRSMDQGLTWSTPVNITLQTHRPNLPAFNEAYSFEAEHEFDSKGIAKLSKLKDPSVALKFEGKSVLKMEASGNGMFPIAVKANRIDFDKGEFKGLHLVSDTRKLF